VSAMPSGANNEATKSTESAGLPPAAPLGRAGWVWLLLLMLAGKHPPAGFGCSCSAFSLPAEGWCVAMWEGLLHMSSRCCISSIVLSRGEWESVLEGGSVTTRLKGMRLHGLAATVESASVR